MTDTEVDPFTQTDPPGERSAPRDGGAQAWWSSARIAQALGQPLPTAEQTRVIEAPLAPMLVVAGAGSGKTETMAARVVYLVANGLVAPGDVLGLTFTRKAAAELSDRIRARLRKLRRSGVRVGDGVEDRPRIATYNSYAGSIVRDHALRLGVDPDATLIGDAGRFQVAAQIVSSWTDEIETDKAPSTVIDAVTALSAELSEHDVEPDDAARTMLAIADELADKAADRPGRPAKPKAGVAEMITSLRTRAQLMQLVTAFVERKATDGVVDFGDQVRLAATIANRVPEVGASERSRYRVVLLDEYQDTSVAQVQLLHALFCGGHPVTAVGDPNQAIYGWRGAAAGTLFAFPSAFGDEAGEPARTEHLSTAWRNDTSILAAANRVAGPLRAAQSDVGTVPELRARPGADVGRVHAHFAETEVEEAEVVAEFLRTHWSPEEGRTAAVLCRKRRQFEAMEPALRAAGLPCEVVGLAGLLSTPEVSDIRCALQVAHDPSRGDAMMRLLTGPSVNLGAADLYALSRWAKSQARAYTRAGDDRAEAEVLEEAEQSSIVEAVDVLPRETWQTSDGRTLSPTARDRLRRLGDQVRQIRSLTYLSMPELVTATEQILGLDIEVVAHVPGSIGHARRHLDTFTAVASAFAGDADAPTLGAFLAWLDAAADEERGLGIVEAEPDPTAIQIMTVHAAKGLEWDTVVVAGLNDGDFPAVLLDRAGTPSASGWLTALANLPYELRGDRAYLPELDVDGAHTHGEMEAARVAFRAAEGGREMTEERRLAYVALTRAKHTLLLTGAFWQDRKSASTPSRFLRELIADGLAEPGGDFPECPVHEENPTTAQVHLSHWPAPAVAEPQVWRALWSEPDREPDGTAGSERARQWWRDAELLLAERDECAGGEVPLPAHLSASAVVSLSADPASFVRDRRRPIPRRPSVQARRGTRFHAWVEQHFGARALIELDALPGADDEVTPEDLELTELQRAFLASPWAARSPIAVEADIETPVAGIVIRCRIDAVFAEGDGVRIVDWKTGSPPTGEDARRSRQMQLALYRIAWSRLHALPLERVQASFHYVATGTTVSADKFDEAQVSRILAELVGD